MRQFCVFLGLYTFALGAVGASFTGCGNSSGGAAHYQGLVTLNGKPIPDDAKAFVVFVPDRDKTKSISVPITGGRYDSPHTPAGPIRAYFEISRAVGPQKTSERTGQPYQDVVSLVPAKYATGIALDVTGDNSNQDFQLTD